jgi:hypothetical protein
MEIVNRVHPRDIPTRSLCLRRQPLTYGRCRSGPLPEPVSQAACLSPAAASRRSVPLVVAPHRVILGVGLVGSGGFIALAVLILLVVLVILLVLHDKLLSVSLTVKY